MAEQRVGIIVEGKDDASAVLRGIGSQFDILGVNIARLASSSVALGVALATAMIAAVGFTKSAVESTAAYIEELKNLNIITGYSIEFLSNLKYVAEASGGSLTNIAMAARGMAMSLQEAESPTSRAAKALREIGLSLAELDRMTPEQRFLAIGNAIMQEADATDRAALAMDLFKRSGTEILPMLDDLQEKMRIGAEFGPQITAKNIEDTKNMTTAATELSAAWDNFTKLLGQTFMPEATALLHGAAEFLKWLNAVPSQVELQSRWEKRGVAETFMSPGQVMSYEAGIKHEIERAGLVLTDGGQVVKAAGDALSNAASTVNDGGKSLADAATGMLSIWQGKVIQSTHVGPSAERTVITPYQSGGTVPGPAGEPQLAMVHGGEVITPPNISLPQVDTSSLMNMTSVNRSVSSVGGSKGGDTVIVNVGGSVVTERQLTQVVREQLLDIKRRNTSTGL